MKQNKPKVTVVTVTYNAKEHLEQTIKSIIKQDYPNIEYIIIDGASTDGTIEIIKKYIKHIDYWISEPDNGIYDAMNKGIDVATGEWINFLNAGDSFCDKNTIINVMSNLKKNTDIISGDMYFIDSRGKKNLRLSHKENFIYEGMFCYHQTMFTRINLMKELKFDTSFKIAGDYDFVMKCYHNNKKFQFLDIAIANFLENGISSQYLLKAKIEDMFIQSKYIEDINLILKKNAFNELKKSTQNNNYLFTKLLNDLYIQCEYINHKYYNKKIILYGYGHIGEIVLNNCKDKIYAIVDQNFRFLSCENISILNPESLNSLDFDYILISVLGREEEIQKYLISKLNIQKEKILTFNL